MKRTSLATRNALLFPGRFSWSLIALLVIVLIAFVRFAAPNAFLSVTAPLLNGASALAGGVYRATGGFRNAAALSAANDALMNENAALGVENRTLSEQVSDLTQLLGIEAVPQKGIVAGIVARPPESAYDALVITGGKNAGITQHMEAFGAGGVPLGIVSAVTDDYARVELFSASGMRVDGWIGTKRIPVTIEGSGGGTFTAQVPRSAAVAVGDAAYLSGPGALPFGSVAKLGGEPSDPGVTLLIKPALNLFSATWVVVRTGAPDFAAATSTP